MGGTCSTYGDRRREYRVLVVKPDGRRSLGRPIHRWTDNVKKWDVGVCTGLIWLKIGTGGGHLYIW